MSAGRVAPAVRRACAAVLVSALTATAAGCGGAPETFIQPEGPTIAIGVAADEPGLARWHDGTYAGFEVEIARYVAKKLGYANKQIVFKQVMPSNRLDLLDDGTVDMVVAGMPMPDDADADSSADGGAGTDGTSDDGSDAVAYAGPYLTVSQGLLVRPDDAGTITDVAALAGRDVCVVAGSGESLLAEQPKANTRERDTYPQCVTDLMVGTADAIAGDDVVLAGLARSQGAGLSRPVSGVAYGGTRYGVALPAGADTLAQNVEAALKDMREDGSYAAALRTLRADTGWRPGRT
ncbi:transporter substrate-binding domain-containing protein [Bifidobacterium sp. MA2]|uniref:Transporter substrate-binding domain-containing protein n=1 Tax=Bifidobacterium santillanense TaxID=2809028 RepID=A0ABS5UR73_9BIFI|nr:transporter substrate-binding domain-containing protein [Bifidobacterium santillanense]MBT1173360.1 transporter substrate-binding domain-containing protein [Bifidobacterium santillanense]